MSAAELPRVDAAGFEHEVLDADRPVLVDFWASWCGQCRLMAPVVHGVAEELAGVLDVRAVDTEAEPELAARLGVQSLPTLIIFDGGTERLRITGPRGRATLMSDLKPWVGGAAGQGRPNDGKDGSR